MSAATAAEKTFDEDVEFLRRYEDVHVLAGADGRARAALVGAYQGRVMTSTAGGGGGRSCGWINYGHVASGKQSAHINVYGGEDRFWLGPEGGQFAIFFRKGDPFDLEHWQTPALIDTESYERKSASDDVAVFHKRSAVTNHSGYRFVLDIERTIRLLDGAAATRALAGDAVEGVQPVVYESVNRLTNAGTEDWRKDSGLLSIWILGMYKPGPRTTIVIPFRKDAGGSRPAIVDDYFGRVPPNRLKLSEDTAFFSGDGRHRSKIGVPPERAKPVVGSYDGMRRLLTIVQYTAPEGATDYVNSQWSVQDNPYAGDAVNAYNDGPPAPGAPPLGPFYELETSSPALALRAGESAVHVHRTFHFEGAEQGLDRIASAALGVGLDEISAALA